MELEDRPAWPVPRVLHKLAGNRRYFCPRLAVKHYGCQPAANTLAQNRGRTPMGSAEAEIVALGAAGGGGVDYHFLRCGANTSSCVTMSRVCALIFVYFFAALNQSPEILACPNGPWRAHLCILVTLAPAAFNHLPTSAIDTDHRVGKGQNC